MARFKIRKQTIWRVHSTLGLFAGLGLLVIGLSGSILMFSREIDGLLRPEVVKVGHGPSVERMPMDDLVGRVSSSLPGHQIMGWAFHSDDPGASDRVWMKLPGDEHWLYAHIDPYRGRILSRPAESAGHLTGWLLELHYSFLGDHIGMLVAGLFAVILFLLGISGVWLYRDFFRTFLRMRWGQSARILFSDLHKFVGINSVVFNLILGFTGAWWNLSHLIGHLVEETPQVSAETAALPPEEWASVDGMMARSQETIAGFMTHYLSFPETADGLIGLHGQHGGAGPFRGLYGSRIEFDPPSGEVREHHDIRDEAISAQILDSFMPLHYGTFGGWPIRILWSLGGLAPGILAVSGFVIWRSRHRSRIRVTKSLAVFSSGSRDDMGGIGDPSCDCVDGGT